MEREIKLPPDTYNQLLIELPSGRTMAVLIPDGIDDQDIQVAAVELEEICNVVRGWLPN